MIQQHPTVRVFLCFNVNIYDLEALTEEEIWAPIDEVVDMEEVVMVVLLLLPERHV